MAIWRSQWLEILAAVLLFSVGLQGLSQGHKHINITVGYLPSIAGEVQFQQGLVVSGAISYAIHQINNDSTILPNHRLNLVWADSKSNSAVGVQEITRLRGLGALAFFGPEDVCQQSAVLAADWNLPVMAYKCEDGIVVNGTTSRAFVQLEPSDIQAARSIIALLRHLNWKEFSIVKDRGDKWTAVCGHLREEAKRSNLTITGEHKYREPFLQSQLDRSEAAEFETTHNQTPAYVFLGDSSSMLNFALDISASNSKIPIIYLDQQPYNPEDPTFYFRNSLTHIDDVIPYDHEEIAAMKNVVIITNPHPSNPGYDKFKAMVNRYNEMPPFSFPSPFGAFNMQGIFDGYQKPITPFAAYLYDSVYLYAKALQKTLAENGTVHDDERIVSHMCGTHYKSILGYESFIDNNCESEGSYILLSLRRTNSSRGNFTMGPSGTFTTIDSPLNTRTTVLRPFG